jgi:hypothetical protein
MALAPKVEAISNSRTSPVIRETKVSRDTVEAALKSDTTRVYAQAKRLTLSRQQNQQPQRPTARPNQKTWISQEAVAGDI